MLTQPAVQILKKILQNSVVLIPNLLIERGQKNEKVS